MYLNVVEILGTGLFDTQWTPLSLIIRLIFEVLKMRLVQNIVSDVLMFLYLYSLSLIYLLYIVT
jgi:hypothetical protein